MVQEVIDAIIAGPRAWVSAAQLRKRFAQLRKRSGQAALREAQEAGIIELWDRDRSGNRLQSPAWTLTVDGARLHGVWITEIPHPRTGLGVPFWTAGDEEDRPRRLIRGLGEPRQYQYPDRGRDQNKAAHTVEGVPIELWGMSIIIDPRMRKRRPPDRRRPGRKAGATARRAAELRRQGLTWGEVADTLNAERIPTPSGKGRKWTAERVRALFVRLQNRAVPADPQQAPARKSKVTSKVTSDEPRQALAALLFPPHRTRPAAQAEDDDRPLYLQPLPPPLRIAQ